MPHWPGNNPKADVIMDWESRVCEFAPDSPLEEDGFEPSVPYYSGSVSLRKWGSLDKRP
jgi:hypothetical protein